MVFGMSRLFLTVVDHVSRDFRSPCANMTLGVAALAADFFGVSFLSPACYYSG